MELLLCDYYKVVPIQCQWQKLFEWDSLVTFIDETQNSGLQIMVCSWMYSVSVRWNLITAFQIQTALFSLITKKCDKILILISKHVVKVKEIHISPLPCLHRTEIYRLGGKLHQNFRLKDCIWNFYKIASHLRSLVQIIFHSRLDKWLIWFNSISRLLL